MISRLATPDLYVQSFDWDASTASIVAMNREAFARSSFLDERIVTVSAPEAIPLDELLSMAGALPVSTGPVNFIFHTTFCGSTLLSRCLDRAGICLSYREPYILHQMAFRKRARWAIDDGYDTGALMEAVMALLTRTYHGGEVPLIKPSDSCNNIARDLLARGPQTSGLLLYGDLASFVVSNLKHHTRRIHLRRTAVRAVDDLQDMGFAKTDIAMMTDAQVAGMVWFSLIMQHINVLADPSLNVKSLDAEDLYSRPADVLQAVSDHFGLAHDRAVLLQQVETGAFKRDAKQDSDVYDVDAEAANRAAQSEFLESEIRFAAAWVNAFRGDIEVPAKLDRDLLQ